VEFFAMATPEQAAHWEQVMLDRVVLMREYTNIFITYIAGDMGEKGYALLGSGTFVDLGGAPFLLTASHVTQERLNEKYVELFHFAGENRRMINLHYKLHESPEPTDLAMLRVDEDIFDGTSLKALNLERFAQKTEISGEDLLFVHGFPGKSSYAIAFTEENTLIATSQPYGCFLGTACGEHFEPEHNFAVTYPMMVPIASERSPVSLPMAKGMSGSALWKVNKPEAGEEWSPALAQVIGVVYRQDLPEHSLLTTKVEYVRDFINEVCRREGIRLDVD